VDLSTLMKVNCPACGSPIASSDMNLANMAASCRQCDALIDLRQIMSAGNSAAEQMPLPEPIAAPRPPGLVVDDSDSELKIIRSWFSWRLVEMAFFCLGWNSFLVVWYWIAFNGFAQKGPELMSWLMIIGPSIGPCPGSEIG
jgi:hypothetical protein